MNSKSKLEIDQMSSVELAANYANRMVEREAAGGDIDDAMHRIEAKVGVGYWLLWSLRYKRPKSISNDVFNRLRGAYLTACERQIANLQHEISIEQSRGGDADLEDLATEVAALASKVRRALSG